VVRFEDFTTSYWTSFGHRNKGQHRASKPAPLAHCRTACQAVSCPTAWLSARLALMMQCDSRSRIFSKTDASPLRLGSCASNRPPSTKRRSAMVQDHRQPTSQFDLPASDTAPRAEQCHIPLTSTFQQCHTTSATDKPVITGCLLFCLWSPSSVAHGRRGTPRQMRKPSRESE